MTILVIRAATDEVFGAYCSAAWNVRNTRDDAGQRRRPYWGSGESFLFSLKPEVRQYDSRVFSRRYLFWFVLYGFLVRVA